jgi:hypothetical protein
MCDGVDAFAIVTATGCGGQRLTLGFCGVWKNVPNKDAPNTSNRMHRLCLRNMHMSFSLALPFAQ